RFSRQPASACARCRSRTTICAKPESSRRWHQRLLPARREVPMQNIRLLATAAAALAFAGAADAADAPPGASSCTGCHPATRADTSVPRLNGRDAAQTVAAMTEFRTGKRPATVMDRIAKGFTEDETKAIAAWFAAQKD